MMKCKLSMSLYTGPQDQYTEAAFSPYIVGKLTSCKGKESEKKEKHAMVTQSVAPKLW